MQTDLRRLMLDSNLLPSEKQDLLTRIAVQAEAMDMACYIVGGFVRDLLLNKPVNDFDIVVEGEATRLGNELVKKFGGKLTVHQKFHTAIWLYSEIDSLDLATARTEVYESRGALPKVKPSTMQDDLRRRDFTINAMAVRLDGSHSGELLDPLNGKDDLEKGLIRVLHPASFTDDPTRILRAIRYEQRYGFEIDPHTLRLINRESLDVLSRLSGERIRHEFDLIFEEEAPARTLLRAEGLGLFSVFNPELPKLNKKYQSLFNSYPDAVFDLTNDQISLDYLLWFMDSKVEVAVDLAKRLDFTAELTRTIISALQLKSELPALVDSRPSVWTARLEKIPLMATYGVWLVTGQTALKEFLVKWRGINTKTTGSDLKALGISPGPRYKEILSHLRAAWLDGDVHNEKEEKDLLNRLL